DRQRSPKPGHRHGGYRAGSAPQGRGPAGGQPTRAGTLPGPLGALQGACRGEGRRLQHRVALQPLQEDQDCSVSPNTEGKPRVAVVTGGSRGLGRVVVERLLEQGWTVATLTRTSNSFIEESAERFQEAFFWQKADLNEPHTLR